MERRRDLGRVQLCIGRYAEKPYFMEKVHVHIYSVEELCYCLIQNVYLIDQEVMDEKLAVWLEEECGLGELAAVLRRVLKEECSISEYVGAILTYTGYGSREDADRTLESIEKGTNLSVYEKRKTRADYFAENGKYVLALKNYDSLLKELPETEKVLQAQVLHNRGVAYAELFQFQSAAESFRQAYECGGGEPSYISYLAAKRMKMEETEYVDFVAGEDYELSLKVEKLMEDAAKEFEGTQESRMLFTLKVCKEEDNSVSYYKEVERITDELKEKYRKITAE